jgi:4-amino-4-deoxy-L-arabinose transferase-like glycosyltransferase
VRAWPFAVVSAATRLVPLAVLAGLATAWALARAAVSRGERAALAGLVSAGVLAHGAIAFAPDHNPPDLGTHITRILDLGRLPLDYHAILRYGSHLPTDSQTTAPGTDLFGERALVPYSPLPNLVYYAAHRLGADLRWAVTGINVLLAMAVAPWMWWVARRLWDTGTAWRAALLYTLDLAVWHHVGRVHAPAAFGGALGTAALLYLADRARDTVDRRRILAAGAVLGIAVLGYSSLVVLFGLLGVALLALLALDARGLSPEARRGTALALVAGGLLAGALFYFHYVPGIVRSAGAVEADPDIFSGRTFLIFHNEGRQSLRIWRQGLWVPLFAAVAAAPFALRRARPDARPVLVAWFFGWALLMVMKEPFLFPRMLRWAKEDQFLSPLLDLLIAAGIAAIPRRGVRWAAAGAALGAAAWLQAADYLTHLDTLWQ